MAAHAAGAKGAKFKIIFFGVNYKIFGLTNNVHCPALSHLAANAACAFGANRTMVFFIFDFLLKGL